MHGEHPCGRGDAACTALLHSPPGGQAPIMLSPVFFFILDRKEGGSTHRGASLVPRNGRRSTPAAASHCWVRRPIISAPHPQQLPGQPTCTKKQGNRTPCPGCALTPTRGARALRRRCPAAAPATGINKNNMHNKLRAAMSNTVKTTHAVALPWAAESLQATGQTHPKEHPSTLCSLGAREKIEQHVRHQGMHPIRALGMGKGTALT